MPAATHWILFANIGLIFWTLGFGYIMAFRRVSSVKAGRAPSGYYVAYNQGAEPNDLAILTRHYANLHENPVMFYAISALTLATGLADMTMGYLAAGYVAARVAHTLVHVSVNAVLVRFAMFLLAVMLVTAMAIKLLIVGLLL